MLELTSHAQQPLPHFIVQLIVIVVAARLCGMMATRVGQPSVIGEIAAGVLLGPSLLGWMLPEASGFLFPPQSLPILQLLSQIGVLLFMFVVGTQIEPRQLRGKAMSSIAISHVSIVVPFALGAALSVALHSLYAPPGVSRTAFALFCGIAMSITAFPVLARILEERQLTDTPLGVIAIACAAIDDVTAWTILAFVVAVTTSGGAVGAWLTIVALLLAFVAVMIIAVAPVLRQVLRPSQCEGEEALSRNQIAVVLAVLLSSAFVTETIGIHAIFGAFIAGAIMPSDSRLRLLLRERLESISSVSLLPLFFTYTGLRTEIALLDDARSWGMCLIVIVLATVGKLGGTAIAARWTGLSWLESLALGSLMNTRGLMELVALNVGYDLGILTPACFTMMVLMALATTAMTGPLLSLSLHPRFEDRFRRSMVHADYVIPSRAAHPPAAPLRGRAARCRAQ